MFTGYFQRLCALLGLGLLVSASAHALPVLTDPSVGQLSLVAANPARLPRIDGLAFDAHGNLFGALETAGSDGGIVYIDKQTGNVTPLHIGTIQGADQIRFAPDGRLYATNELTPASINDRVFRLDIQYGAGNRPVGAGANLQRPEGC